MINNEILFEVNGITKSYKEKGLFKKKIKKVLNDVSFSLKKRRMFRNNWRKWKWEKYTWKDFNRT